MKDLQIYEAYCQNKPRSESLWRQCSDCAFFQVALSASPHNNTFRFMQLTRRLNSKYFGCFCFVLFWIRSARRNWNINLVWTLTSSNLSRESPNISYFLRWAVFMFGVLRVGWCLFQLYPSLPFCCGFYRNCWSTARAVMAVMTYRKRFPPSWGSWKLSTTQCTSSPSQDMR